MLFGMKRVGRRAAFLRHRHGGRRHAVCRPSGSSPPTAGCRRPPATPINAAGQFVPSTGGRSSSTRPFPTASCTWCWPPISPPPSWSARSAPGTCCATGRRTSAARIMFSMAMWMAALVAPMQIVAGDLHGLNTLEHQPAKIAAMEGHFETRAGAPLILFGWPDMAAETTRYALEIPQLGSFILTHDWDGEVKGLKAWPQGRPPQCAHRVLGVPHHGGPRLADAGGSACGACGCAGGAASTIRRRCLRVAVLMGPAGLRRGARRLDHDRGRAPALHRLRPAAHRRLRLADRARRRSALRWSLFVMRLFVVFGAGTLLHPAADARPPAIADERARSSTGPDARRRHHARGATAASETVLSGEDVP